MNNKKTEWIGVDLDGTLAEYHGWKGPEHIGLPVPRMLARVRAWLAEGKTVKLFTARAGDPKCVEHVRTWLIKHGLDKLEITNTKDFGMVELWDDRAVEVVPNRGITKYAIVQAAMARVLTAAGVRVATGLDEDNAATMAERKITATLKRNEDALAHIDAAADALRYIDIEKVAKVLPDAADDLRRALLASKRAVKALKGES